MYGANLYLTGANTIVQRVSSGLFILPQKLQVKPCHADTLCINRRTKSGQGPLHVGEDFLCLMFRCFGEGNKRPSLTLHGSHANFIESAIHSYRAEEVGIRSFLNHRQQVALCHRLYQIQLPLRLKKGNHGKRRLLVICDWTSGSIRSNLIEHPVKAHHLTVEIIESAKTKIAMFPNVPIRHLTFVIPGYQSGHQGGLIQLTRSMIVTAGDVVPSWLDHCE